MLTNVSSGFRIKRPLITNGGFVSDVDPTAKAHLEELNQLLARRVWDPAASGSSSSSAKSPVDPVRAMLSLPLSPKRIPANTWASSSLAYALSSASPKSGDLTLSDYIDTQPDMAKLKYALQGHLSSTWFGLDFNTRAVLNGYPAITDYLIAYAFLIKQLADVDALANFLRNHREGVRIVANYAIVSGARSIIDEEQLNVLDYNKDDGDLAASLREADLLLSTGSFRSSIKTLIEDFVFNSDEAAIIDKSKVGPVPENIKASLIKYIQKSPIKITQANADFYLPVFISQILSSTGTLAPPEDTVLELADQDFAVQFRDDTSLAVTDISRAAVHCAAQLYFGMVVGEELDVFGAVNYFTHKHLIRGGLEIRDARLRSDLRMYVFSDQFVDLSTNKVMDRTRPAERQMFYRQVFDEGQGEVTEDVIVNPDFHRMWKVLILESAKYLERAQASPNPDNFVSRQNVMQAVEDLQYNLSTNCTGMVNVIAPMIDAELNFVLSRILQHAEVRQHLIPSGGTWQRVVEALHAEMRKSRPRATTLYNKARLGESILRSIADYQAASFESDEKFSQFISQVDAFITTQSILQESLTDDLRDEEPARPGIPMVGAGQSPEEAYAALVPQAAPAPAASSDEWDF